MPPVGELGIPRLAGTCVWKKSGGPALQLDDWWKKFAGSVLGQRPAPVEKTYGEGLAPAFGLRKLPREGRLVSQIPSTSVSGGERYG